MADDCRSSPFHGARFGGVKSHNLISMNESQLIAHICQMQYLVETYSIRVVKIVFSVFWHLKAK